MRRIIGGGRVIWHGCSRRENRWVIHVRAVRMRIVGFRGVVVVLLRVRILRVIINRRLMMEVFVLNSLFSCRVQKVKNGGV